MKPPLLKLTAFLLIIAGAFTFCQKPPDPDDPNYPIEIPFTELETQCQWENLAYNDEVVIINSNEELAKYIVCTEGDYPAIDFSKHTLLLTSGKTTGHLSEITAKDLKQLSSNKYKLNVEVTSCNLTHIESWSVAFVVEKLNKKSYVELNVICKEMELELGLYERVDPHIYIWPIFFNFIDKENIEFIGEFGNSQYLKYVIVRDSIILTDCSSIQTSTHYFHIIHNSKFEIDVSGDYIRPFIMIFQKKTK